MPKDCDTQLLCGFRIDKRNSYTSHIAVTLVAPKRALPVATLAGLSEGIKIRKGEDQCACLFSPKNSFQIHPAKFKNFKTEKFSDEKSVSVEKRQSLKSETIFSFWSSNIFPIQI